MKNDNPYRPSDNGSDLRELFVTTDIRSIPAMELRPMCSGFLQWLTALLTFKVLRAKSQATFATESRRLVKVDAEEVTPRIMKRFEEAKRRLMPLDFRLNYYASIPAIGPIAAAVMTMSRADGKVHFFSVQVAQKSEGKISEDGHFGFDSLLASGGSIVTVAPSKLPRPRQGTERQMVASEDPERVLKVHRERIRDRDIKALAPEKLFDHAQEEARLSSDDLLRRQIIRPATQAEISRIRNQSRV